MSFRHCVRAGLAALPLWVAARAADDITALPAVQVTDRKFPLTQPDLAAARTIADHVAGGVTVVDAEFFQRGRDATLHDALAFTPGVFIQSRFGSDESRLSIRGSGLQRTYHGLGLMLLQDGVPFNLADGGFDFQAIDLPSAAYVDVLRGGNALALGATTLGGAINLISRTGRSAPPAQVRLEGGSFGFARAQGSLATVQGDDDAFGSLTLTHSDGYRDWSRQENARFTANAGRLFADRHAEARVYVSLVRSNSQLPGSLTFAQFLADPEQANSGNLALRQQRNYTLARVAEKTALRLPVGDVEASVFYSFKQLHHPISQLLEQRSHDAGLSVRYYRGDRTAPAPHAFAAGLIATTGWLDDQRYLNLAGSPGDKVSGADKRANNVTLYAEDTWQFAPRWTASATLAGTQSRRQSRTTFGAAAPYARDYAALTPRLGLLFTPAPDVGFYANLSRSFEPPSYDNVGTLVATRAQKSTTFELGTRGRRPRFAWELTLYHSWLRDELLNLNDAAGQPLGTINADRTRHTGAELGASMLLFGDALNDVAPGERLVWQTTYTWGRFRFAGGPVYGDRPLAGLPAHVIHTELRFEHRSFYVAPAIEWIPQRYAVDHAHTLFAPGYTLLGFKFGQRPPRGWAWFVEAKNLLDRRYVASTGVIADALGRDAAQFLPGDGRAFYVGLEHRW